MSRVIVVVGEALVDLVIGLDGSVSAALGGAPFNTARTCGRLGATVAFMGAVSDDRFGTTIAARLDDDHVVTDLLQRVSVPTTLAVAELDAHGAATYRFYIEGTSAPALQPAELPAATTLFAGGLGLVLEPMSDTVVGLVEGVADGVMVMIDVNCRPAVIDDRDAYLARVEAVLGRADVVKISDDDLAYLAPDEPPLDAAGRLLTRGPRVVLLTEGGAHVTVVTPNDERLAVPVAPVDVVDTIGAGDAFAGGFMAWWAVSGRGRNDLVDLEALASAAAAATRVAGIVCRRRGADPPWRHELADDWAG
jgi:fructokinase